MGDVRLLLRLRVRHARTFLVRALHATGSDLVDDRGWGERSYQAYIIGFIGICLAMMWLWLLDTVQEAFVALGPDLALGVLLFAFAVPAVVFAVSSFRGLRASWVKLSHPDIAYVAASPIGSTALVGVSAAITMIAGGAVAAPAGYLLAVGVRAALGWFVDPLTTALIASLWTAVPLAAGRVVGAARLALPRTIRRWKAVAMLALASLAAVVAYGALAIAWAPGALAQSNAVVQAVAAAVGLLVAGFLALLLLAKRVDRVRMVEENALYADTCSFGFFSLLDSTTVGDYRRRCKLARRGPFLRLPQAAGPAALVARAALSLVRQYEGLPALLMLGAGITPFGVSALLGGYGVAGPVFWLAMLVGLASTAREVTRAFRDDMRVRLVRDQLPYGTLALLVGDSLPAFCLVTAVSCATVPFTLPAGAPVAPALVLAVALNAAVVLSFGLEAVRLRSSSMRPWGEGGLAIVGSLCGFASLLAEPLLVVAAAIVACATMARMIRRGSNACVSFGAGIALFPFRLTSAWREFLRTRCTRLCGLLPAPARRPSRCALSRARYAPR